MQLRQSGNFNISSGSTLTLDAALRQNGTQSITITGAGVTNFNGANAYTGATNVNGGTLNVGTAGTVNSSSGVTVAAGARFNFNSTTALTKPVTLNGNGISGHATMGGVGTINLALTLDNIGDTLAPGKSPGVMSFATNQTWNAFSYDWEVNNFTGTSAGTDFDQISITGTLGLTGGSGSYALNALSLTGGNVAGNVGNFSDTTQSWTVLSTTGGITGFDPANWTINTAGFSSSPPGTGSWALAQSGSNLVLTYTVVPEPGSGLFVLGALGICFSRRSRGKV